MRSALVPASGTDRTEDDLGLLVDPLSSLLLRTLWAGAAVTNEFLKVQAEVRKGPINRHLPVSVGAVVFEPDRHPVQGATVITRQDDVFVTSIGERRWN